MEKFITFKKWTGKYIKKRMVNQPEIVNYFKENPGNTEKQMQEDVYGYYRNRSNASNKKYADCLRRALYSGKLYRKEITVNNRISFAYYASAPKLNTMPFSVKRVR